MENSRRKLGMLLLLLAVGISLVISGCSSSDSGKDSDGKTTITFWHPMTDITGEAVEKVIEEFEKSHPDIKVNAVYSAGGSDTNEKLLTAIAGGNPPDVTYFDRFNIGSWASEGSLADLSELAANDGVTEDMYYSFAWEEASYNGKLYGIPTTTDSRLLFYNKDHFEEAGLDPENPPSTIDELVDAAEKLTKKEGNRFDRIGLIPWYDQGTLYSWGWAFGGEFYDTASEKVTANDPKIVEALQWMTDFAQKYNVEDIAGFTDSQGEGAMDPFLTGQISMKVSGPWVISAVQKYNPDLNFGVTPIPTPTGTNFTTWSGGWSVVMPKGAKNEEAAWEFMKYFGGEEGQKIFSEIARDFSVIDSVNEAIGYKDDPVLKEFIDILPESNHRPVISEGNLLWNELINAVDLSTRGNGTPQEILDKVTDKVNKALAENE